MGAWDVDVAPLVRLRDEIEAGQRLGPRLVVTGTRIFDIRPNEARQAVRALKAAGADFVKISSEPSKETYLAVAEECQRVGLPFAGHVPDAVTVRETIEAGQRSIEHMGNGELRVLCYDYVAENNVPPTDVASQTMTRLQDALNTALAGQPPSEVWGENTRLSLLTAEVKTLLAHLQKEHGSVESLTVLLRETDAENTRLIVRARHSKGEMTYKFQLDRRGQFEWENNEADVLQPGSVRQMAEALVARRVWLTPTMLAPHNAAARRELLKNPDPRLDYLLPKVRRQYLPENDDRLRDLTSAGIEIFKRFNARDARLAVALHQAGVQLLAGTDEYFLPGFGLHEELALLVQAGLSPLAALRTATLNPAEFLGREKESGSIAVGKRADLVLLERNPLTDIRHTTSVWGVIRAGKYLNRAALDRMLETVRKKVRQHKAAKG
jgi:hypothetical protein